MPGLGLACVGLLFGGLAVGVALGGVISLPYGPIARVAGYVRAEPIAMQVIATTAFASSMPLALYPATASTRLPQLGLILPVTRVSALVAAGALWPRADLDAV